MRFYLGTHEVSWLKRVDFPLFVSDRRFRRQKSLPRARCRWALDSGGFTELNMFGQWTVKASDYATRVRRYQNEVGNLDFAAPQDWMCEPDVRKKTGKTTLEHQRLTVENFLRLRDIDPALPFIPVLQGWAADDYMRHIDQYTAAGVDLCAHRVVGVGTVCRRQGTAEGVRIIESIAAQGIAVHAFGFKRRGLSKAAHVLYSADSMAWSFAARRSDPLPGCSHKSCANCIKYATTWRNKTVAQINGQHGGPQSEGEWQLSFGWH